jgi:hypothetical protein
MPRPFNLIGATVSAIGVPLVLAAGASAATLHGTVVHDNARAHSFVVAQRGGALKAVHARKLPPVGRTVAVRARLLRNGTWLAQHVTVGRRLHHVTIKGTVTFVAAHGGFFVLSARGTSFVVHGANARFHTPRRSANSRVAVGEIMTVQGSLEGGSVSASDLRRDGEDVNGVDLEGTVQAVDPTARTLTISADDSEQSGATVTVAVPAAFDLGLFAAGQSVELIVSPNPDGTYTLEQSSNDTGGTQADNPGEQQGDGHGDGHASAEQQCLAQQADPNFPSTHNGLSFTLFYERDAGDAGNARDRCVSAIADSGDSHGSGSGSGGGSGGSGDTGGSGGSGDTGGSGGSGGSGDSPGSGGSGGSGDSAGLKANI